MVNGDIQRQRKLFGKSVFRLLQLPLHQWHVRLAANDADLVTHELVERLRCEQVREEKRRRRRRKRRRKGKGKGKRKRKIKRKRKEEKREE